MEFDIDKSPPRMAGGARRRSSFLERRESIIAFPLLDNMDETNVEKDAQRHMEEVIKIHTEKINQENRAWKNKNMEVYKRYKQLPSLIAAADGSQTTLASCYSLLSAEDMAFLQTKPDIIKIQKDVATLCDDIHETLQIKSLLDQRTESLVELFEEKVEDLQADILDYSMVESNFRDDY